MIGEYKRAARQSLSGNWLKIALVLVIVGFCGGGIVEIITNAVMDLTNSVFASTAVSFILGCLLEVISFGYLKSILLLCKTDSYDFNDIFSVTNQALDVIVYSIVISIATLVGTLLFIIPGIYISLRYSLTYYIMADDPGLKWQYAANLSAQMMRGRCMEMFLMQLSFIGWSLLSVLTLGIGFFFLIPYMHASICHFYLDAKNYPQNMYMQ